MVLSPACSISECGRPSVASLDVRTFCRTHFIIACYDLMDEYARWLEANRFRETTAELVRRFLAECTRQTTDLAQNDENLDNLERARLLDILLRAGELGRYLRRSPRRVASFPVRLCCEKLGRAWESDAFTTMISRHGAAVECDHPVEVGEPLLLVRRDTSAQVRARVVWRQPLPGDRAAIGLEFLQSENFWGIDWPSPDSTDWPEEKAGHATR